MSESLLPTSGSAEIGRHVPSGPSHGTTVDPEAWIAALSGHVATSRDGHRVWARTRNPRAGFAGHAAANIEFHAPEYIGYARLRLRHDPAIGFVAMVNTLHLRRTVRGQGVGAGIVASWARRLSELGIRELQFEAVSEGHLTSGRLFWARDGALFRDPQAPHRLLDRLAETAEAEAGAIRELRRRVDSGELSTPADLYRDPRGRRALAADDWAGRWPLG